MILTDSRRQMSDPREEINRLIEIAERNAYRAGWRDALAAVAESAERLRSGQTGLAVAENAPEPAPVKRRGGRPASGTVGVVEECIKAVPGMTGVQVVKAAQSVNPSIKERSVRTCLRRLRIAKKIWKRGDLWYPKAEQPEQRSNGELPLSGQPRIEFLA